MPLPTIPSGNVASATAGGFEVANSCRFNYPDDPYMSKTPSSPGSQYISTFSAWIKKVSTGRYSGIFTSVYETGEFFEINFESGADSLEVRSKYSGSYVLRKITSRVFRDPSAWYHICVIIDTTDGAAEDRCKIYVNGVRETSFSTNTNPGSSQNLGLNTTSYEHRVGRDEWSTPAYFDGYMAEVHWIDGTAKAVTDFGEFDDDSPTIWKPKEYTGGSYGTNGFYLDFADSGNLGDDESGNTLDLAESNLAAVDQATDTPTNNFATMNPLDNYIQNQTFAEGNLQTLSDNPSPATSTIGMTAGKWWIEAKAVSTSGSGSDYQIGIISNQVIATEDLGHYSNNYAYYYDGNSKTGNSSSSYGDSYTHGDIIGIAVNLDDNELKFYKNGTVQNSGTAISITAPASTSLGAYFFALGADANANKYTWYINFGNPIWSLSSAVADENGYGSFEYAPPSGFLALCTKNLGSDGG